MPKDTLSAYNFESITVAATSIGLTLSNILSTPHAEEAEIFVETAPVRFRKDGTAPTASVGEILNPTDRITLGNRNDMANIRFIRTGSTSATLRVHYRR